MTMEKQNTSLNMFEDSVPDSWKDGYDTDGPIGCTDETLGLQPTKYMKAVSEDMLNRGLQLKVGLNIDPVPFNTS